MSRLQRTSIRTPKVKTVAAISLLTSIGTPFGNMNELGGLAAAFDGNTSQTQYGGAGKNSSLSGFSNYIGLQWPYPVWVQKVVVYSPNNNSILGSQGGTSLFLQAGTNGIDWDNLSTETIYPVNYPYSLTILAAGVTPYIMHRCVFCGNGNNTLSVAEVQFYGRKA